MSSAPRKRPRAQTMGRCHWRCRTSFAAPPRRSHPRAADRCRGPSRWRSEPRAGRRCLRGPAPGCRDRRPRRADDACARRSRRRERRRRIDSMAVAIEVSGASVSAGPRGISVTRASSRTMLNPNTSRAIAVGWPSLIWSTSKSNMPRNVARAGASRRLRSSHDLTTLIRVKTAREPRDVARRAARRIHSEAGCGGDRCQRSRCRRRMRIVRNPRSRARRIAAVGAQMDRTADHAQRKIIVDGKRPRSRAAAAPGRHPVLAQRAPALRLVRQRVAARSTTSGNPARGSIRF